jgi:GH24 family phage-related lysozyme (muramidase)
MNNIFYKLADEILTESHKKVIAVDLDGTLAKYTTWKGATNIGQPIPEMVNRVKKWIKSGKTVVIFTARANDPKAVAAIKKWLQKNDLPILKITNVKSPNIEEFWDDRAIQVKKNKGIPIRENIDEGWKSNLVAGALAASTAFGGSSHTGVSKKVPEKAPINMSVKKSTKMNIDALKQMLIRHEGSREKVYLDSKKIPTIGVGFNLRRQDAPKLIQKLGLNYSNILNGKEQLRPEHIDALLMHDIQTAINDAKQFVPNFDQLPEKVQMIVVDMAFNLGLQRLMKFEKFRAALLKQNYIEAANQMKDSAWYNQVKNRGVELVSMMRSVE